MVIKRLFFISQVINFAFFALNPENDSAVWRRIKVSGSLHNKVLEKILSLSQSNDPEISISAATALVKLGKETEGYQILKDFSSSSEPEILLAVARAYLDLEKIDPLNKIRGIQTLDRIELEKITEAELGLEIAREYFKYGFFIESERVLLYLEKHFSGIQDKVSQLRKDIDRRRTIFSLITQIKEKTLAPSLRLNALRQLLMIEVKLEELIMVKEVFGKLAEE
ncbi:MAG: hypothetical protein NC821_06315, partial [Candidatus Omnitrophica bacterium]|nr:hypothetical protein [Candidatus Omnitrophota bacterium]